MGATTMFALCLGLIACGTVWGLLDAWIWKRRLPHLQAVLNDVVERYGRPQITLPAGRLELLVSEDYIHYLDLGKALLIESLPVDAVGSLEISEKSTSRVWFHFLMADGTRSPVVSTDAILRFSELFDLMIASGKEIRYSRGVT